MGQESGQQLVDSLAREILATERLAFLLDGPNKELFLQVGSDEGLLGEGMVWIYPEDLAEFEEVLEPVERKVRELRADTLGRIIAVGQGRTGQHEIILTIPPGADGRTILERTAAAVVIARMYDLLDRDQQPLIREAPESEF